MAITRSYSRLTAGQRKLLAKIHEHGCWSGGQFETYITCCEDGYIEGAVTEDGENVWVLTEDGRAVVEASRE